MKILIVEDERSLAELLQKRFEKEGFTADIIHTGEEALTRIEMFHENYSVAVLDLTLPGKDGVEVCSEIRKKNIMIPILALTARTAIEHKIEALDIGFDDYLTKPFSFEELLARVRALLRRPKTVIPAKLSQGSVTLDLNARRCYVEQQEVPLTMKEFSLLEHFMRHPDQVLTREQLLDHLWDHDFSSFSNVIDVHIKNLRKRLQNSTVSIDTVRGIGYRLRSE